VIEQQPAETPEAEAEVGDLTNVRSILGRKPVNKTVFEAPVTAEEVAEYRRLRPLLLQMLEEWQMIRSSQGCPVFRQIVGD
jgi:hypothetical protein